MTDIYRLFYRKEILCYSCKFVPQIRSSSIVLGSKYRGRIGPLTLDRTWGLNVPQNARWLTQSATLSLNFTRIWFLKVGISDSRPSFCSLYYFSSNYFIKHYPEEFNERAPFTIIIFFDDNGKDLLAANQLEMLLRPSSIVLKSCKVFNQNRKSWYQQQILRDLIRADAFVR